MNSLLYYAYFREPSSECISLSFKQIWFISCLKHMSQIKKTSFTIITLKLRNFNIICSILLLFINIVRLIFTTLFRVPVLMILTFINIIVTLLGLVGNIRLNILLQSIHVFSALLIQIIYLVFFTLQYRQTKNSLESIALFCPQIIDLFILIPLFVGFYKLFQWDEKTIQKIDQIALRQSAGVLEQIDDHQQQEIEISDIHTNALNTSVQIKQQFKPQDIENKKCVVCLVEEKGAMFYKCGHICCCLDCAYQMQKRDRCPICRADIKDVVKCFQS